MFFLGACDKEPPPKPVEVIRPVKIMKIKDARDMLTHGFPGTVRAAKRTVLSFKVSGRLVQLPVEEGQYVKKGDLIAQLDQRDFLNELQLARARYREAQQQFIRYKQLYAKKQVSKADFDRYLAARDVAKAKLEDAQNALCDTKLVAPFDGLISKRYVENYYEVQAKEPIVNLQDISRIEILVNVPELFVAALRQNLQVEISARFESIPGKEFPVDVKEYSTEADPTTQTYQVVLVMDRPPEANILPGMTANVTARIRSSAPAENVILIPAVAVLNAPDGTSYVWIFDEKEGAVRKRKVKIGRLADSGQIRILEGLKPGEVIVIAGVSKLTEGMKVRPWEKQKEGK